MEKHGKQLLKHSTKKSTENRVLNPKLQCQSATTDNRANSYLNKKSQHEEILMVIMNH